jgi:hypothetical protein
MRIIIQMTSDEYTEYLKNADVDTTVEADMFIKDCLADHAAVFIYSADIRVVPILPVEKEADISDIKL